MIERKLLMYVGEPTENRSLFAAEIGCSRGDRAPYEQDGGDRRETKEI
jgi:hypothetical protein